MKQQGYKVHRGTKSWWDGTVKTMCGETLASGDRILFARFFGYDICETCEVLHAAEERAKRR